MINEVMRALGLLAGGALFVLVFLIERQNRDDEIWSDADWEVLSDEDRD